jgi:hypothetical protein
MKCNGRTLFPDRKQNIPSKRLDTAGYNSYGLHPECERRYRQHTASGHKSQRASAAREQTD